MRKDVREKRSEEIAQHQQTMMITISHLRYHPDRLDLHVPRVPLALRAHRALTVHATLPPQDFLRG